MAVELAGTETSVYIQLLARWLGCEKCLLTRITYLENDSYNTGLCEDLITVL